MVVLSADSKSYTRRLTRQMLTVIGVRSIYEATDGIAVLNMVPNLNPDVLLLDWHMSGLDGPEVMRIVRSPGQFPKANLPAIMLTDRGLHFQTEDSYQVGV